ncbi:MAG: SWIM-type protein [Acidobacteriota bacterium]|nr:SWIM-type protein [Acidobacteriota bacterium]
MARRKRRGYNGYSEFPVYVSVGEKRAKAEKSLSKLKKSNPAVNPVVITGSAIATSWWGKSWNKNLEGYADYSNRIGRGRSYVRSGAVLDLQIKPGEITALVQGSRSKPYSVIIQIKEITAPAWESMKKACAGKLDSLPELLAGKFPKALGELFTERGKGLFPSPREIGFSCSCPDYASMCKHVAAALYGVSARLDTEPGLFFTLRKVEIKDLVSETVQRKSQELLKKAKKKSSRVLEDSDLSAIFGIQLDEKPKKKF